MTRPLEIPREHWPRHVAIIMDGNGRWAKRRGLARIRGHEAGAKALRRVTELCAQWGIECLTVYAFSAENWRRPGAEIRFLMQLLHHYLIQERPTLMKNNIRLAAIGRVDGLPARARKALSESISLSSVNTGMTLCLALNYGGRSEIVDAARRMACEAREGRLDLDAVDEDSFRGWLYAPRLRDPDLLIRTGGDIRISNFLLWELSYTELYFTPTFWPDFREEDLREALREYARRERRFGGLGPPGSQMSPQH